MSLVRLSRHQDARAKLVDLTHHDDATLDAAAEVLATSPYLPDQDMARKWLDLRAREKQGAA